jgi:hypothetical protein
MVARSSGLRPTGIRYGKEPMKSETLTSIGANARRLFADGELLYRAERYPSALALAILSIEEAGKYSSFRHASP